MGGGNEVIQGGREGTLLAIARRACEPEAKTLAAKNCPTPSPWDQRLRKGDHDFTKVRAALQVTQGIAGLLEAKHSIDDGL